MKVLLLKDVPSLGQKGMQKEVSRGYAQNFLLPKKLAIAASDEAAKTVASEIKNRAAKKEQMVLGYTNVRERLKSVVLQFSMKASSAGKTFGRIGAADLQNALQRKGISIDAKWVQLSDDIKEIGAHTLKLRFPDGKHAAISVIIEKEEK